MSEQAISSLVPVAARDFSGEPIQTISARDLHAFLESKQDFSTWIKRRIEQYGFAESVDYVVISGPQESGALETEAYAQGRIEYFMTLDMAKELAMVERNDKGREARHYFIDCERQLKTAATQLPQDYLSALKALVESEETKQLALAQARALTQQIETDRPYTELARAITGQSTMTRRDWCALMKTDHGLQIGERELTAWLIGGGYCYRDALTRELRAYAHHADLFKLEVHLISGFPRKLLMVTGDGVFQLTPVVVADFAREDAA